MRIRETPISGLVVVETTPFQDERGAFTRLFCDKELASVIGNRRIVQINHSRTSTVGAIRGMHFQHPPHAEMKMVRCLKGKVWDVAVDLRHGSPTFLRWHGQELSPDNALMMVIPEGYAHGFQVLAAESELLYLHTASYIPAAEGRVRYNDPAINILWPFPGTDLSEKDKQHPDIKSDFQGLRL